MRLQLLRTFVVVAELGSPSLAAQRLLYSESSVACHIRELEKSLGAQLFTKANHSLELTRAGQAALGPTVDLLRTADRMAEAVHVATRPERRPVRSRGPLPARSQPSRPAPSPRRSEENRRSASARSTGARSTSTTSAAPSDPGW